MTALMVNPLLNILLLEDAGCCQAHLMLNRTLLSISTIGLAAAHRR